MAKKPEFFASPEPPAQPPPEGEVAGPLPTTEAEGPAPEAVPPEPPTQPPPTPAVLAGRPKVFVIHNAEDPAEFSAGGNTLTVGRGRNVILETLHGAELNGVKVPGWTALSLWGHAMATFVGKKHGISFSEE